MTRTSFPQARPHVPTPCRYLPTEIPLIFVMGATNVGKTSFMDCARGYAAIGLVEVGKLMRAKYPPDYFKGQGAPAHTQTEAWQMMTDGIAAHAAGTDPHGPSVSAVLIDGQPRNVEQTQWALKMPNPKVFLHLWCPPDVREERARKRDAADPAKLELSLKRLVDDPRTLFDCLTMIRLHTNEPDHVDTDFTYDTTTYTPYGALRAVTLWACNEMVV